MVAVVDNTIFYNWNLLRVQLKNSHQTHIWDGGYVN